MPLRTVLKTIANKAESDLLDGLKDLNPKTPAEGLLYGSSWIISSIGLQYDQVLQGRGPVRIVCVGVLALGGVASIVKGVAFSRQP